MILGWFRRKKVDAEERREWESFAREMESVLDDVSMLLELDDREHAITPTDFWRPEYVEVPRGSRRHSFPMLSRGIPVAAPQFSVLQPIRILEQEMVSFRYHWQISDCDLLIRRSPSELASLLDVVRKQVNDAFEKKMIAIASSPIERARAIIKEGS